MRSAEWLELLGRAHRWLLPGACLLCDEPAGPADPLICDLCRSRFHRLPMPQCPRCGQPPPDPGVPCRLCAGWSPGLARVASAVWLDAAARRAVHRLKYGGWWRVAEVLATVMAGLAPLTARGVLVPIPLGERRRLRRGYNQAERLARALGRPGLEARTDLLRRVRETASQTALPPESRQANVAGAFRAAPAEGLRVVLVDDVFTTGATLVAAAGALVEAGAGVVEAVTFARALPPLA